MNFPLEFELGRLRVPHAKTQELRERDESSVIGLNEPFKRRSG
jgi:hypothetical protein